MKKNDMVQGAVPQNKNLKALSLELADTNTLYDLPTKDKTFSEIVIEFFRKI
jgi:hypothetical protein